MDTDEEVSYDKRRFSGEPEGTSSTQRKFNPLVAVIVIVLVFIVVASIKSFKDNADGEQPSAPAVTTTVVYQAPSVQQPHANHCYWIPAQPEQRDRYGFIIAGSGRAAQYVCNG